MGKMGIGVIGCGNISGAYLGMGKTFPNVAVLACADLDMDRARERAAEFQVPRVLSVQELLKDTEIDIVVNLTIPGAHADIAIAALQAGKHTYSEKPFAVNRKDGRRILDAARTAGKRVGCAPDTFMGGGIQTCRKIIDDGWIGEPIGVSAHMACHGHESWHHDPAFYYHPGGGPMFDMGPYYLTALLCLLGPVRRVTGSTRITFPERTITSAAKYGEIIKVQVPTHIAGIMDFGNGAIGTILQTFDVWAANLPLIEVYGTEGSLSCPDPNGFGGSVRFRRANSPDWTEVNHIRPEAHRGIGVADMAAGITLGRPHRASGDLAFHVLDIMEAIHDASDVGRHVELSSGCTKPDPLPAALNPAVLD